MRPLGLSRLGSVQLELVESVRFIRVFDQSSAYNINVWASNFSVIRTHPDEFGSAGVQCTSIKHPWYTHLYTSTMDSIKKVKEVLDSNTTAR